MIKQQDINKLANVALFARNRSIVPISNFAVGAALLSSDGQIFVGCNIECYGQTPSICAERVALFKALSEGVTDFLALAVAGGPKTKHRTIFVSHVVFAVKCSCSIAQEICRYLS